MGVACKEMIEKQEEARGMRYKWAARSRPDLMWMVPHPPLSLMDTVNQIWVPEGEDYDGINVRHAIGLRDLVVPTLLSRLDFVLNGDPIALNMPYGANDETLNRRILEGKGIKVGRYDTPAHLSPCPQWSLSCWRG